MQPLTTPKPWSKSNPPVPRSSAVERIRARIADGDTAGLPGEYGLFVRTAATTPATTGVAAEVPPSAA